MRVRRLLRLETMEVRRLPSGLTYSLTTDQLTYQVGQPIVMTFTETNIGDQPTTVEVSPTDFVIPGTYNGLPIWQSDPANQGAPPTAETLQPGQSLTQSATWDGSLADSSTNTISYPYGCFNVTNPNAPQGMTASFQIASPYKETVTTDQLTYQPGQPIQFTFTMTNTSDEPATLGEGPSGTGFLVSQDGQTVWSSNSGPNPMWVMLLTLQPGQSWTTDATWDGLISPAGGGSPVQTADGSFVVTNEMDRLGPSASFQIQTSPLSYKLDVPGDDLPFRTGQPISFSYTITNTSDQPVTFNLPSDGFIVAGEDNNFGTVWESVPARRPGPRRARPSNPANR